MSGKKFRYTLFIFFIVPLLILAACAGIAGRYESPTVQIADIKIKEIKALETSFDVQLRVLNPNDFPINTRGISCDVEINNIHLATGVSGAAIEIPAFGTSIVPIEVFSSAYDVVRSIISVSNKEVTKYRIKGRLRLEKGSFMLSSIPFESEGDLNIKGLKGKTN